VDIVETADGIWVQVALPGVAADSIVVEIEPGAMTISAHRSFPVGSTKGECAARIHALEIPYGRFERRIGLPTQALTPSGRKLQDGCLTLMFSKKESS
jgi:HSP20 family molecular chaperone IbpA